MPPSTTHTHQKNSPPPLDKQHRAPLDLTDVQGTHSSLIGEAPATNVDGTAGVHPASPNFQTVLAAQIAAAAPQKGNGRRKD